LPNSSAVVTTFTAGHRHKSDKCLGAVLEAKITSNPNLKARAVKSGDNSHLVARF
jgi:hypothetical protein